VKRRILFSDKALKPIRPYYSQAVEIQDPTSFIFVSGQTWDPKLGGPARLDAGAQTEYALGEIQALLQKGGATMDDIVKVTVYLRDINHLDRVAEARYRYFKRSKPASTLIVVSQLWHPDVLVEIDAIAAVTRNKKGGQV